MPTLFSGGTVVTNLPNLPLTDAVGCHRNGATAA
jgi:hypothetical protein